MAKPTRSIDVRNNLTEMALAPLAPYLLMVFGTIGALGAGWALRLWTDFGSRPMLMGVLSGLLCLSGGSLGVLGYKVFKQLQARTGQGWGLAWHVVVTVALGHVMVWLIMCFGSREFVWATWVIGSIFVLLTWAIRRMARGSTAQFGNDDGDVIGLPGSSFLD